MSSRVDVRRVSPDEWEAFRDTRLAALVDAPSAFITTHAQALQNTQEDWQSRAEEGGTVLAWVDGRPVGIAAGYVPHGVPELVAMWVEPESRGTGVVEALIDAVVTWAQAKDADELRLWVVEGNERAERAYERYGFRRTSRAHPVPGRPEEREAEMTYAL